MVLYSGVSGGCCARPAGFLGSHCTSWSDPARLHWPFRSGYFDGACAAAPPIAKLSAAVSAIAAIELRSSMALPSRPLLARHCYPRTFVTRLGLSRVGVLASSPLGGRYNDHRCQHDRPERASRIIASRIYSVSPENGGSTPTGTDAAS